MRLFVLLLVLLSAGCVDVPQASRGEGQDGTRGREGLLMEDLAYAVVLSDPYPRLLVEVDHLPGVEPSPVALEALMEVLRAFTLKTEVAMLPPEEIRTSQPLRAAEVWTIEEVRAAHRATFSAGPDPDAYGQGDTAFLHVLYLDGHLRYEYNDEETEAIGVALEHAIVVFRSPSATPVPSPMRSPASVNGEKATLLHEAGHAMGLIGRGAPIVRPHGLPDDPAHSANPYSVMYAGRETLGGVQAYAHEQTASPLDLFDEDDKADLAALRAEQGKRSGPARG